MTLTELGGRAAAVSTGSDDTVQVWDLRTRQLLADPGTGHDGIVWSVAVGHDQGRPLGQPYTGHRGGVLAVTPADLDGRLVVASAGEDSTVHVWDLATRHPVGAPYRRHRETVRCLAISA